MLWSTIYQLAIEIVKECGCLIFVVHTISGTLVVILLKILGSFYK